MSDNSKFVDRIETRRTINNMKYTVGKSKELLVFLTGKTVGLLVAISSNFSTHDIVTTHIFTYFCPMFFFTIGKVYRIEVKQLFFNGTLLCEGFGLNLYIQRGLVIATVYLEYPLVFLIVV